jgi:hypothetical protein
MTETEHQNCRRPALEVIQEKETVQYAEKLTFGWIKFRGAGQQGNRT